MLGERSRVGSLVRGMFACVLLLPVLSACTAVAGGGVVVAVVAIGALTSHCYDYLDVSVLDAQGRKTCNATVTATNGGDEFELQSCYYAPLSDGHWTLRASMPGATDATSTVEVEHAHDCTRHTLSVELSLNPAGSVARPTPLFPTKPAPNPPAAVPLSPAPPVPVPAAPPAPATSVAPPASAAPASSAAPAVGVFPNQTETPR